MISEYELIQIERHCDVVEAAAENHWKLLGGEDKMAYNKRKEKAQQADEIADILRRLVANERARSAPLKRSA